ncbi:hypothetical protein DZF79_15525 [Vibrio parahaemolyticus]|nr:hypothetical protein [Vibrio parahaemolyticus]
MNVSPKNLPALIANELALITEAVSPFYSNNGEQKEVEKAIQIAFKAGLDLGQIHFRDNFIRNSLEGVSGSQEHLSVLFYRADLFADSGKSPFTDSFSFINMNLDLVRGSFEDHFRETIYRNFDSNSNNLILRVKAECKLDALTINTEIPESEQKQIIENYKGFGGAPIGSFHCVEMCSPRQSMYSIEHQGQKVLATLLNPIFSHGFYFATAINDQSLLLSYREIMKEFLDTPYNNTNANEIMSKISGSNLPLLNLISDMACFAFDMGDTPAVRDKQQLNETDKKEKLKNIIKAVSSEDKEKQRQEEKQNESVYLTKLIEEFTKVNKAYSQMC